MEPSRSTGPSRAMSRSPRERPRFGAAAVVAGIGLTGTVVFVAPLLVGSVHRPAVLGVSLAAGLGAALTLFGEVSRRGVVRVTRSVLLPLSLLLIPLLQSIPLPAALAGRIDPAGDALLVESPIAGSPFRPLSLDPPDTRAIIAKAGAALAVFLVAFHLASGRPTRRLLLLRGVAASTVVAMAIGLGHRILGETRIFGHFSQSLGLLNGPFINRNHLAEFLELGAFVCVACALAGASALNRVGWLAAALMCGACALATFSRGAVLSLVAGTIAFVVLRQAAVSEPQESGTRPSRTLLWVTVMLILLGGLAVGLGADQIVTRVRDTQIGQEARLSLWKDSLARPKGTSLRHRSRGFRERFSGVPHPRRRNRGPLLVHRERAPAVPGRDGLAGLHCRADRGGFHGARVAGRAPSRPDRGSAGRGRRRGAGPQLRRFRARNARYSASVRGHSGDVAGTDPRRPRAFAVTARGGRRLGRRARRDRDRRGRGRAPQCEQLRSIGGIAAGWNDEARNGAPRAGRTSRRLFLRAGTGRGRADCAEQRRPIPAAPRAQSCAAALSPLSRGSRGGRGDPLGSGEETAGPAGMAHRGRDAAERSRIHPSGRLGGACASRGDRSHRW